MTRKNDSQQLSFLQSGPYRLTLDCHEDGLVYMSAYSNDFPVNLSFLNCQTAVQLMRLLGDQPTPNLVPFSLLPAVMAILEPKLSDEDLIVEISDSVTVFAQISQQNAPVLHYTWSAERQTLQADCDVRYLGQGWFLAGTSYWQWPEVQTFDDPWLHRSSIQAEELPYFLRDLLTSWQQRGFPVTSDLTYFPEPAAEFVVLSANEEEVELSIEWHVRPGELRCLDGVPGYVLVRASLRPGILPASLVGRLAVDNRSLRLSGEEIPALLRQFGALRQTLLIDPDAKLVELHSLASGDGRLLLSGEREERRGIGTIHAVPTFQIADTRLPAAVVSRRLESAQEFVRLPDIWVTKSQVQSAGIGSFGRAQNGFALDPITLTPMEVLWRGSPRLEGPWAGLECPEVVITTDTIPVENALNHLAFLARLGLPGGLLGTVHQCAAPLMRFLEDYQNRQRMTGRILVVGTKTALNHLSKLAKSATLVRLDQQNAEMTIDRQQTGIVLLTPAVLERMHGLEQVDWDIICLVNADSLVKSRNSRLFGCMRGLHKLLFLGLFTDLGFRQRKASREAISELMEVEDVGPQLLWRYLLRDPSEPVRELVPAYRTPRARAAEQGMVEYVVRHRESPGVPYYLAYEARKFVELAKRLTEQLKGRPAKPAPFVEYYQPRPSYESMSGQQLAWYVYWRDQVNQGVYPDTGLDYITLRSYELINQVNTQPLNGYLLMHQLWRHYRERFPSLDSSLLHWLVDYLLQNRLSIDPLQPYRDAVSLGVTVPYTDILLKDYLDLPWQQLPYYFVERLSSYPAARSRFYTADNAPLLQKAVAQALEIADEYYRHTFGQGIWQFYRPRRYLVQKRLPFHNALYAGQSKLINFGSALPYSEQSALRSLISAVFKHTENVLREQQGYRGRLRSYQLPDGLARMIAERLTGLPGPKMNAKRVQVSIDLSKVGILTRQSDEVRTLLLRPGHAADQSATEDNSPNRKVHQVFEHRVKYRPSQRSLTRHSSQVPSVPVQLPRTRPDQFDQFLSQLGPLELQLLLALGQAEHGLSAAELLEISAGDLVEPVLDHINEIALDSWGDLIISTENEARMINGEYRADLVQALHGFRPATGRLAIPAGEWLELYSTLSPGELEALAILANPERTREWRQFCLRTGQFPEVLVDRLNDLALEMIGDLLLGEGLTEPEILPDYLTQVRGILEYWRGE